MDLENLVDKVKESLGKNFDFNVQKFVLSKDVGYKNFLKFFKSKTGFSPQGYKYYAGIKKRFKFDEFKKLILKNIEVQPFIVFMEIANIRNIIITNTDIVYHNKIRSFIHREGITFGLSFEAELLSCNGYNTILNKILDKKEFMTQYDDMFEKMKRINNLDFYHKYHLFSSEKEKGIDINNSLRKHSLIEVYKMFLGEIYSGIDKA